MALIDKFAANLRSARTTRKLSQGELAKKAKISISYVSMLERGQRSPPLETLESVAKALHIPPVNLLR